MASRRSKLKDELRQTRPFRSPGQEAGLALLRTADLVRRRGAAVVEPAGITLQQYNVLRILRGAGEPGLPTLSIADRMVEQTPGITRLIDRLVDKQLVRRMAVAGDRRRVQCCITARGLDLLTGLDAAMNAADDLALAMLSDKDISRLIGLLERIRAGLRVTGVAEPAPDKALRPRAR